MVNSSANDKKANMEKARIIAIESNAVELLSVLKDVIEQLDGIGIPEWNGAEGLYLRDARKLIDRLA